MPKFLIIRFSSIGDILQCMGIIGGIRKKFPDAEIHWITRKDMASFLTMDKRIHKIWTVDKSKGVKELLRISGELRKEHFDYIYDAHNNLRSHILRFRLNFFANRHTGFVCRSKERMKRFLLFRLGINRFAQPFRSMYSYRKPLAAWGITDFPDNDQPWVFPADFSNRLTPFIGARTVTLVPSANWKMKRWPISHWQELVRLLPEYDFIILAGPNDRFCQEIQTAAPERVVDLAGKTTPLESSFLVLQSHLVISADTGFLHAADLFRIPALALMGPTAFGFPSHPTSVILETNLPCRPCTKDGSGKCKQAEFQQCMKDISPEEVARQVRRLFRVV